MLNAMSRRFGQMTGVPRKSIRRALMHSSVAWMQFEHIEVTALIWIFLSPFQLSFQSFLLNFARNSLAPSQSLC